MNRFLMTSLIMFLFSWGAQGANQIISINGYLYYDKVDEWSKNITDSKFNIWNAVIGEGSLKYPAEKTLFVIEADSELANNKISVVIKQKHGNKDMILHKGHPDCSFEERKKKLFCPVILLEAGHGLVTVSAELIDVKNKKVVSRKSISKEYGGGE